FFEQYSHEPQIAVARFWIHSLGKRKEWADRLQEKWQKGYQALDAMERHLASHKFFVGERYSIADIALYAYTHVADEGDFDLGRRRRQTRLSGRCRRARRRAGGLLRPPPPAGPPRRPSPRPSPSPPRPDHPVRLRLSAARGRDLRVGVGYNGRRRGGRGTG